MRVLIVCPRLCHGGAERVAVSLANGLADRGHQVFFLADLFQEITYHLDDNVKLGNLISTDKNKIAKWLSAVKIARKVILSEKPDVIIGIMALCSFIAKIAAIGLKTPIIATEHDAFERPASAPMPFGIWVNKFIVDKIYDCVTVLTESDKRVIGKRLKNVVVMPNPLALTPVASVPKKDKIILAAGRIDNWHYKGFDLLIEAWGRIALNYPDWELQIAGIYKKQESREYLDSIAHQYGITDRVRYLGFVEDMTTLYQKSSIFVLSSRYEAFGLVLIEAMSQGCACIACDYNGRQSDIITDNNEGLLCKPEDAEEISSALEKVIQNGNIRVMYQLNGLKRSHFYSIANTLNRWEDLLETIIRPKSRS